MANRIPRFQVLKRDDFRCLYCGATPDRKQLHLDHVIPKSRGGTDDTWNLAAACRDCNLSKSNYMPSEEIIRTVRERDVAWTYPGRSGEYGTCMWCGKPVLFDYDDDDRTADCETCNRTASVGFEAGRKSGL